MPKPRTARRYLIQYGVDLALAYVLAVIDVAAILIPLRGHTSLRFEEKNQVAVVVLVVLATIAVGIASTFSLAPTLRWFLAGDEPTKDQREGAGMKLAGRQSVILMAAWAFSAAVMALLNRTGGSALLLPLLIGVLLGGPAAAGTGLLLSQRTLRPIMFAATRDATPRLAVPGVFARLVLMWFLCSAVPVGVIATFVVLRSYGWLIQRSATLDVPILVMSLAALILGLPTMILTSRSIADPLGEVVDAMAQVEHGHMETRVGATNDPKSGACKRDSIGWSPDSPNVTGCATCSDVTSEPTSPAAPSKKARSCRATWWRPRSSTSTCGLHAARGKPSAARGCRGAQRFLPDRRRRRRRASGADQQIRRRRRIGRLRCAVADQFAGLGSAGDRHRALATKLRQLPVDFGIGVFGGTGLRRQHRCRNRYEYTVIGDAVNEAARLADLAKTAESRTLCSAAAIEHADEAERGQWSESYSTVLRGRSEATQISVPLTSRP